MSLPVDLVSNKNRVCLGGTMANCLNILGLAFIAYPEAVTKMPGAPFWSFLFFAMLITLGLDSQFTMTETLTTAAMDQWPSLRAHKAKVVIGTSVLGFILGLTMCTNGGVYMFTLIDWFSASW